MLARVLETIRRNQMLESGQRIGVAVSGGADSVCLLHLLRELAPEMEWSLTVLHLDHRLRGPESCADAAFVRSLAQSLGLPFVLREANVAAEGGNLEQAARRARLAFFCEAITTGMVDRVALGHTRSDQAETVLYRFLRGSGTAGLAGIRPVVSPGIVRPLLEIDRPEVEEWLGSRAIPWRDDSTNSSPRFARNRIRHLLLPELQRDWNPSLPQVLAHTAEWARAEEDYWEAEVAALAARVLEEHEDALVVRARALAELPLAVARRLIRYAIALVRGNLRSIDFRHIEAVLGLARSSRGEGRCSVPGVDVRRSLDWVRFAKPRKDYEYQIRVAAPGSVPIPGTNSVISLELIEKSETSRLSDNVYNGGMGCLDWGRLSGALELRNWRPGDQYQPAGSTGGEKIKTLFQNARIPVWERSKWPVLLDRSRLVWTRRFGPAAGFVAGETTKVMLRLREVQLAE